MSELRKESNEKLENIMREMKNSKRPQSVTNRKNYERNTSQMETPKYSNNGDGEMNASNLDSQEKRT